MRIAVTGSSGIVGSRLTGALTDSGHEVFAIDRGERPEGLDVEFRGADLTSFEQARDGLRGADAVVHLAGINAPVAAPEWQVHGNNTASSYNVLAAAAELGISRVVQSSSVNAIGMSWSREPEFDYFPVDLAHRSRNEDGYSLSKLVQELQADSITRRFEGMSVVSLRLHAVLENAAQAQMFIDHFGERWAVNGLFGYCTHGSVDAAIERACTAPISGHEVLWVTEPETFATTPSAELAERFYPDVERRKPFDGHEAFFDISRTIEVLDWSPETLSNPPLERARI